LSLLWIDGLGRPISSNASLGYRVETVEIGRITAQVQSLNHKQSFWNFIVVSFRKE